MNHLSDLLRSPWAMSASHLRSLEHTLALIAGLDMPEIEARLGFALPVRTAPAVTSGGVAVIGVEGVLMPRPGVLAALGMATSTDLLLEQIAAAEADPAVRAIVLNVDSPGGSVNGTPSVADAVHNCSKPTAAIGSQMCSAAYWIASAADAVYATELTATIGSIGVVATHRHQPTSDGRVLTEISSGKYKQIASTNKALDAEGAAYLQAQVDHLQTVFVDAVAANRGVTLDQALAMADQARTYVGQKAIDVGLVDGVSSINSLVARLSADPTSLRRRGSAPSGTLPAAAGSSALAYAAVAERRLPPPLTKTQKVELVQAHQAKHGGEFADVYLQLGLDKLHPHEEALRDVAQMQAENRQAAAHAQVARANRYAIENRVTLVEALQALGVSA